MNIPMVDLQGQYRRLKTEIDREIQKVLDNASFINGSVVAEFAKDLEKYLGIKHVIPCGNGTDALQVAMMALDLKPGDEVITTTFTFIATAEVIALLGLTPVLVDVLEDTMNIDPSAIRKAITSKTKAIVPVHLFGQCANMDEIMAIADENNLFVIEDNAQAIGANYTFKDGSVKKAGTIGHIGTTSFFPSKNLGAYGDGGAIFTNDDKLAEQMRAVVNHGMKVRYYHDYVGINSRLDSIQAAVLKVKLPHLDDFAKARNYAANYYNSAFAACEKITTPITAKFTNHVFHQYTLILNNVDRAGLQKHLSDQGISNAVYYPVPLHQQKAYKDDRYEDGSFPIAEKLSNNVISLPIHTEMTDEQLKFISDAVLEFSTSSN
ncbi:MAG: DegT/DnrJ/EryC1/StrS family aminotransferase [Bacteroidales bacterium]|jgi:UDP-2-acetamido-2-deoxy-ribo-hexuluronate aminotransferase|nr:DegT/DnrJ/EryC1/StrS family aminotransferase [Bacteroidales bacterium]